ncbi:hypothetical protein QVD17_15149 [Tagetes erecta]|uniref:Uncharacterized protein n=1 Tax=Tagetes erecta TaxID=13708 RepID=A0AAD8KVE9_TARER|nr:hypothetical protein QVD17_15149 [Tagetes erecta]
MDEPMRTWIQVNYTSCVMCGFEMESAYHELLTCYHVSLQGVYGYGRRIKQNLPLCCRTSFSTNFIKFFINSSIVPLSGSDLLLWEVVSEYYISSDRFLHFFQKCKAPTGRSRSERKSYTP